jgi:hypothetical protein
MAETQTTNLLQEQILPSAILAPSAHNTQPWKFSVHDNVIDVFVDWSRHLTVSDPTKRELYISLGCAIANAEVAAAQHRYNTLISYFPEGQTNTAPVARLRFDALGGDSYLASLFPAIAKRRTDRSIYDGKPLTLEEKQALKVLSRKESNIVFVEDRDQMNEIAKLTEEGTIATLSRQDFKEELSHWVRNDWTRQPDGMPGYAMGMPAPLSFVSSLMVRLAPIHKQEGPKAKKQVESASAVAVILTSNDNAPDWLKGGQFLEHLWLEVTAAHVAAAPLASAVEATPNIRNQLKTVLKTNLLPQAILRIGHSAHTDLRTTPRRSSKDCLQQ